ncbi:MAG: tRNA (adenosine(37)-N6)-threonylcarbamoyltransferase complex ATPase subunit type 1 TsaE [Clostridia bacterium]|nr:tRNA (adenosine(37)-N6)-threonylcarbamoyltransferase complex ATPase subunit type 1 TsaE [Clostridia bacterium]
MGGAFVKTVTLTAPTERDTEAIAAKLAKCLFPGAFIALRGGLGEAMGIHDVMSPTFTIVQEHKGLLHFDAYRLGSSDELYDIGFEDYLARGSVIVMEWPEMAEDALPPVRLELFIEGSGEGERTLTFTALGEEYENLLSEAF